METKRFRFCELDLPVQQAILDNASERAKIGSEKVFDLCAGDSSLLRSWNVEPMPTRQLTVDRHIQRMRSSFMECADRIFDVFGGVEIPALKGN